jgi:hypothetical protein
MANPSNTGPNRLGRDSRAHTAFSLGNSHSDATGARKNPFANRSPGRAMSIVSSRECISPCPLPAEIPAQDEETAKKILSQKRSDSGKIYSLHEPEVYCVSKGKEHKKYEFGAKASLVVGKNGGVILGDYSLPENDYDGHALEPTKAGRAGGRLQACGGDW